MAVSSVLNFSVLLRHVPNQYRGRVFATIESLTWSVMMVSMTGAGIASEHVSPRTIGVWSGILSSSTALIWWYLNSTGRLPHPNEEGVEPREIEVHAAQLPIRHFGHTDHGTGIQSIPRQIPFGGEHAIGVDIVHTFCLDPDGNLLIANDPYTGVNVEKGKLLLPDRPGLGLRQASL